MINQEIDEHHETTNTNVISCLSYIAVAMDPCFTGQQLNSLLIREVFSRFNSANISVILSK